VTGSPYERLDPSELDALHPRLREYFAPIPEGFIGIGRGTFDRVGTPRVWLWPALWALGRWGIAFPAWRRAVRFTVLNRPVVDARGNAAVLATRVFHFALRDRLMRDAITGERRGLVDYLGTDRRLVARLDAVVVSGALHLYSRRIAVRFGRFELPLPVGWAPAVRLVERFDDATGRQHVSVVVTSPLLGRLYEYSGSFTYRVVESEGT
jgi:hypothetical protein